MSTAETTLPDQSPLDHPNDDVYDDGYLRIEHKKVKAEGRLVNTTEKMFTAPDDKLTEDYITGRFWISLNRSPN
jgi:hypothetical protein